MLLDLHKATFHVSYTICRHVHILCSMLKRPTQAYMRTLCLTLPGIYWRIFHVDVNRSTGAYILCLMLLHEHKSTLHVQYY
jgi:hypothetical protein